MIIFYFFLFFYVPKRIYERILYQRRGIYLQFIFL
nr:MAG TPA: hypothetical protein [Caudoviricetes sp.]